MRYVGASPDTRSPPPPLPTAPPDTLLTHSSILENTGALEQRHVDVMERVGGGWVGGLAEPEDGAAEAAERISILPYKVPPTSYRSIFCVLCCHFFTF